MSAMARAGTVLVMDDVGCSWVNVSMVTMLQIPQKGAHGLMSSGWDCMSHLAGHFVLS